MPDAMTTLLANVGLSDLERRLRDEAIDETTILDLDEADMREIGLKMGPRRKLLTAIREAKNARLQKDAKSANSYKNRAKKATARADELDRVLASVLAHSQHLEAELATLRNMPRLLVRNTTAPPVTPGDGDSAY